LLALLEILIHAKLSHNLRIVLAVLHRNPSLSYFIIQDIKYEALLILTFSLVFEKRIINRSRVHVLSDIHVIFLDSLEKLLLNTEILVLIVERFKLLALLIVYIFIHVESLLILPLDSTEINRIEIRIDIDKLFIHVSKLLLVRCLDKVLWAFLFFFN
jgi:hypothetical protein